MFGIGGGIIVVPALYMVFGIADIDEGVRLPLAIGTSLAVIIITASRSLTAHHKEGAVDVVLLKAWLPWIAIGAVGAGFAASIIPTRILSLIFAAGAFFVGVTRLRARLSPASQPPPGHMQNDSPKSDSHQASHWADRFAPALGIATGFFSSLLGLGGGAAGVMIMGWTGRTMHRAVATASGFGLGVAIPGAAGFILAGWGAVGLPAGSLGFVNAPAFFVLGAMTAISAPVGARLAHRLPANTLSALFGAYIMVMALGMVREALAG